MEKEEEKNSSRDPGQLTKEEKEAILEQGRKELKCGYFCCTPKCLQVFNTPGSLLACACLMACCQGFLVNGIVNVNTSTVERRFDLQSYQAAFVSSAYDISAAVFSLPVSYVGMLVHKPRILSLGCLLMALGCVLLITPQFISPLYEAGQSSSQVCTGNSTSDCDNKVSSLSNYVYFFIFGQVLNGIGGACLYVLTAPMLDENVKARNTSIYVGSYLGFSVAGPAIGFIVGGQFLNIYVDFGRVNPEDIKLKPSDPGWVGAWWLGYIVAFFLCLLASLLYACFPRETPVGRINRLGRVSETYKGKGEQESKHDNFGRSCSDFWLSFKILLTNPVVLLLTFAGIVESGTVAAFAVFLPKMLQFQFSLVASVAAMLAGIIIVPGGMGGQLLGGFFTRWFKLKVKGQLVMMTISGSIGLVLALCLMMRCDLRPIAGISVPYPNSSHSIQVVNPCNEWCNCTTAKYTPICDVNGIEYFSPCHGGCRKELRDSEDNEFFSECNCISNTLNSTVYDAKKGQCEADCTFIYPFIPLFFLLVIVTFINNTAGVSVTLRVVPEKQQTLAVGLQWVMIRLLGNVPFPIMLGSIFDGACLINQTKCGETGSCWIYDIDKLAIGLTIVAVIVKGISLTCFTIAALVYRPPPPPPPDISKTPESDAEKNIEAKQAEYYEIAANSVDSKVLYENMAYNVDCDSHMTKL